MLQLTIKVCYLQKCLHFIKCDSVCGYHMLYFARICAHARSWREFAKCRFAHFPSFFSVHVDTYALEMCNLSWTPHSNLDMDNSLNHSCVSPSMGCLEYTLIGNLLAPRGFKRYRSYIILLLLLQN